MKSSTLTCLIALLIGAVALSGCYGSTRPVVKIGLIAPFEELYRADGYEALNAVKLAVNQRNAAGGVAGRQVALVALNDNGRPDEARTQAANIAVDADVLGVIGPIKAGSSPAGQAMTAQQLPWIALTELSQTELAGGFSLALAPELLAGMAVESLKAQPGIDSVLVLTDRQEARAAAEAVGATVRVLPLAAAGQVTPVPGEGVVWLGDAEQGARLASALGSEAILMGGSELGSHMLAGRAGNDGAFVAWLSAAPGLDQMPGPFVDEYRALAGGDPGPQALLAYDAANLLLDAIELAGAGGAAPERATVHQALRTLGLNGWPGLIGLTGWDADCGLAAGCQRNPGDAIFQHAAQ